MMRRYLAAVLAAIYLLAGLLAINMEMSPAMEMGCVISAPGQSTAGCGMSIGQHLSWWQNTFVGVPATSAGLALLLALCLFLPLALILAPMSVSVRIRLTKAPPGVNLRDYLVAFIAAGKAQPLLYA